MRADDRLGDATGGDGIGAGVVGVRELDAVVGGRRGERALAAAVPVDGLVDDERVDDRPGAGQGSVAVALGLALEEREVVGGVVRHDRQAAARAVGERVDDLGDGDRRPATPSRRARSVLTPWMSDARGGDLDPGIDEPLATLEHLAAGADHADVGGHDAAGVDVDAGGLEVEDGEGVGPAGAARGIHGPKAMGGHRHEPGSGPRVRGIGCGRRASAQATRRRMTGT